MLHPSDRERRVGEFDRQRDRKVSERDQYSAVPDRAPQAEQSIGDPSTRQRREVHARGVNADDGGRRVAVVAESPLGERRRHEQHQERTDSVVREALPHLREEECGKSNGVTEECPTAQAAIESWRRRIGGDRSSLTSRSEVSRVSGHCWKSEGRYAWTAASGRYRSGGCTPPACFCSSHAIFVGGCLMHAAKCPGAFSSSGGTIFAHAASLAG